MNSFVLSSGWFQAWRDRVRDAKAHPTDEGWQKAAVIAQGQFVMWLAIEMQGRKY